MALWLADETLTVTMRIEVDPALQEALQIQWAREPMTAKSPFLRKLEENLPNVLAAALDYDIRPPTPNQVAFATAVSKALGVPLPAAALRFTGELKIFLDRHVDDFKRMNR